MGGYRVDCVARETWRVAPLYRRTYWLTDLLTYLEDKLRVALARERDDTLGAVGGQGEGQG